MSIYDVNREILIFKEPESKDKNLMPLTENMLSQMYTYFQDFYSLIFIA
jgi:hypothetical protein